MLRFAQDDKTACTMTQAEFVKRRKIQFDSFAAMFDDIERLKRDNYQRAGNWDLGTICCHLADSIERSMDGFKTRVR